MNLVVKKQPTGHFYDVLEGREQLLRALKTSTYVTMDVTDADTGNTINVRFWGGGGDVDRGDSRAYQA